MGKYKVERNWNLVMEVREKEGDRESTWVRHVVIGTGLVARGASSRVCDIQDP
jgi:hypothetical protein